MKKDKDANHEEHKIIMPLCVLKVMGVALWGLHFFGRISDRDYAENHVRVTDWFMPSNDILNIVFLMPVVAYGITFRYFLDEDHFRLVFQCSKIYPRLLFIAVFLPVFNWTIEYFDFFTCFWSPFGFPRGDSFLASLPGAAAVGAIGPFFPIYAQHYADCFGICSMMLYASFVAAGFAIGFTKILKQDIKLTACFLIVVFGPMNFKWGMDVPLCFFGVICGTLLAWWHSVNKPRLTGRETRYLAVVVFFLLSFHYIQRSLNTLTHWYVDIPGNYRIYLYIAGVCGLIHLFMSHAHYINSLNLAERFWMDQCGHPIYFLQLTVLHSYGCWFFDDFGIMEENWFLTILALLTTLNVVIVIAMGVNFIERPYVNWLNRKVFRRFGFDNDTCSHGHFPFHSECNDQVGVEHNV